MLHFRSDRHLRLPLDVAGHPVPILRLSDHLPDVLQAA